jgi:dual specificity phosphatase 12
VGYLFKVDIVSIIRLFTLRRRAALQEANITHVLSVLHYEGRELFAGFEQMTVAVDDVDDENLIEHFPTTNRFIREGLAGGGGVLVHW